MNASHIARTLAPSPLLRRPSPLRTGPLILAPLAVFLVVLLALTSCVQPGRTVHPDSDPVVGAECPVAPDPSITTHARIAWQGIANGDLLVKDLGLLEKCMPNAQIDWLRFNGGNDVIQAFGSGSIDIGIYGSSAGVKAMSPPLDLPISLVWVADVIGSAEALVVFDAEIETIEDLKGRTVAVTFGATPHYVLLSMLADAGIADQVEVINLANDKMPAAARTGQIDAAWTWEPMLTELVETGGHVVVDSVEAAAKGYVTFDMQTARDEFLAAEPEFMAMWTRVQGRAAEMIAEDPAAAAESIAAQLGVPPDVAAAQMEGYIYLSAQELSGPEWMDVAQEGTSSGAAESIASTAEFLAEVRMTSGVHDPGQYDGMIYRDGLREALG